MAETKNEHGGGLDAAIANYGGSRNDWIDLSTGINPRAYPVGDIDVDGWHRLPDQRAMDALLGAAKNYYCVPDGVEVIAAPGTQALIQVLPRLLPKSKVGVLGPTYNEHAHCWHAGGHLVETVNMPAELSRFDVGVVVNPNNPTGTLLDLQVLKKLESSVGLLIVDEAFCDLYPESGFVSVMDDNTIILRSFGKFFGLAGLRLGFAIAKPATIQRLNEALGPWAVSGPALEIGARALLDTGWQECTRGFLKTQMDLQVSLLRHQGFHVDAYCDLFVEFGCEQASGLFEHLARRQILVRKFKDRPTRLRLGLTGNAKEFDRLKDALVSFADGTG